MHFSRVDINIGDKDDSELYERFKLKSDNIIHDDSININFNLDSIDEETFDKLWDSYVKANQEYASYNPTREYTLNIILPDEDASFRNTGDDQYQKAKEILFS